MQALGSLIFGSPKFQFFALDYSQDYNPQKKWFERHNKNESRYICAELIQLMLRLELPSLPLEFLMRNLQFTLDSQIPLAIQKSKHNNNYLPSIFANLAIQPFVPCSRADLPTKLKDYIIAPVEAKTYYWILITVNKHTTCVFVRSEPIAFAPGFHNIQFFYFNPQPESFYFLNATPHRGVLAYLADHLPIAEKDIELFLTNVILSRCDALRADSTVDIQLVFPITS